MCWVILTDSPKNYRSMVFNNKFIFYFWEVTLHNLDSQHLLFRCQMQTVHSKSSCVILKLIKTNYDIFVLYNLFTDVLSTSPGVISNYYCSLLYSPTPANSERTHKDIFVAPQPTAAIFIVSVTLLNFSLWTKIFFVFIYSFFRTNKQKWNTGRQFRT